MRRMYRRADAVLTYGEHVSRYVAQRRGSDRNVFVAPQAVEADLFGREVDQAERAAWRDSAGIPQDAPLVLYVGRLVPEKGVETLLDAWEAARHDREVLCLAGEGPLRGRRAGPNVVYAGHVERSALPAAYAAADAVVVPSLATRSFLEPWGLVCNEAMHQGRPVIATHGGRRGGGRASCATARPAWSCPTATRPRSRARSAACSGTWSCASVSARPRAPRSRISATRPRRTRSARRCGPWGPAASPRGPP